MQSDAKTVSAYLKSLPKDRRTVVQAVREVILANLDDDYVEVMQYGMIGYVVPHLLYPAGYHTDPKQPLPFAALASQKNYISLYLMAPYLDGESSADAKWFETAWKKTGKKLDMGKCCVRFRTLDDVPLEVVGEAIRRVPAKAFIAAYEKATAGRRKR